MKSWKTTLAGVLVFVSTAATQIGYVLDSDPETVINYGLIVTAFMAMVGLMNAKDETNDEE